MREKLSPRRLALTERLTFRPALPGEVKFDVTFGYEPGGPVKECFCLAFKIGADRQDEMHQACIAISVALQSGQSMSDLARIMGEDDPALAPHSMIGLIVRAGVMLDDWLTAQYAIGETTKFRDAPRPSNRDVSTDGKPCQEDVANGNPPLASSAGRDARGVGERSFHEGRTERGNTPANVSAGVTAGRAPAPSFRCGDSALEPEGLEDWPTQMTRLAAEEVAKASPPLPPPDTDHDRGGNVFEIPAFLRRTNRDGASA